MNGRLHETKAKKEEKQVHALNYGRGEGNWLPRPKPRPWIWQHERGLEFGALQRVTRSKLRPWKYYGTVIWFHTLNNVVESCTWPWFRWFCDVSYFATSLGFLVTLPRLIKRLEKRVFGGSLTLTYPWLSRTFSCRWEIRLKIREGHTFRKLCTLWDILGFSFENGLTSRPLWLL